MRNAGTVFECNEVERGAGCQGWALPWFPSWETERIANAFPDKFRFNMNVVGPEDEPGNWEYLTEEGGEWAPVPWVEDYGVGSWNMDPMAEWRIVECPAPGDDEESLEKWQDHVQLARDVCAAQENHCNLRTFEMTYKTGAF
jgi:hypothetical protein